jgi:RIO kinase 1
MKRSRDERALKRKSTWGAGRRRRVGRLGVGRAACAAGLGLPVPYPVQIDETEILMEWITVDGDGETAPRLAQTRPARLLRAYFEQLRERCHAGAGRAGARRPVAVQHSSPRATGS